MKYSKDEYVALRNSIVNLEAVKRNIWISMYTIYIAIFVLAFEWSKYLYFVTFVVLIPFQSVLNQYNFYISKASTYIRIFHENSDSDINWEGLHMFTPFVDFENNVTKGGILGFIKNMNAAQLSVLSTICFTTTTLQNNYQNGNYSLSPLDTFSIIAMVALVFITVILNKNYIDETHRLEYVINQYKDFLEKRNK